MDITTHVADLRRRWAANRPPDQPAEVIYPLGRVTLPEHVAQWAADRPGTTAIAADDHTLTYAELDSQVSRFAAWLAANDVTPGDRVGVYLPNCATFVVAMLGILRAGAVHVPINPMFRTHELTHELTDAGVEVLVASAELLPRVGEVVQDTPLRHVVGVGDEMTADALSVPATAWNAAPGSVPEDRAMTEQRGGWDDLAALNYTGGTTGMPKGCEHTHGHLIYTAASTGTVTGRSTDEAFATLCYIPIFWIAGEDLGILLPLTYGGTSVIMGRWDAGRALAAIEKHRVVTMVGTVENYLELLDHPDLGSRDLSSLTDPMAVSFVRTLTPEIRHRWLEAVGSHSMLREGAYGMTETNTFDCTPYGLAEEDRDLLAEPVFCGLPVPGTDIVTVVPGTWEPVPVGEVGEIIVRSPSVMRGYWRNQSATQTQLVDGWLRTGDNGRLDEHGFLHFLGRGKELIKVNGMSVFPSEVEGILSRHPDVLAAAVVSAPDADSGEVPVAFVTPRPGVSLSADALTEWARGQMAPYKVPLVSIVEGLPMTATGKIRKVELSQEAAQIAAQFRS